ncbi:MAG: alanine racemase [Burkholderiaceae bacterium]
MPRPLVATIDLDAMRHNLAVAKQRAGGARAWAVVKADGYGHGLLRAMRGFAGADGLALIEPDAALRLREAGWDKPILLLEGAFDADDMALAARHGFAVAVHGDEQIALLEGSRGEGAVDVYLKLNTGMNRLGFPPARARDAARRLRALPAVRRVSLMTHFANADDPENPRLPLATQLARFDAATAGLDGERSLANSAADLLRPDTARDWVRPGIMLYGGTPGGGSAASFGLRPAMTLTSEVIGLQDIGAGDAVGYGSAFVADRPMRIAVVACGYADGYPRHAPTGTPIVVGGRATRIVGRVSMDMLTADVTGMDGIGVGTPVTLWGEGMPIDDVAEAAGTIGYELMCALARRVRIVERG